VPQIFVRFYWARSPSWIGQRATPTCLDWSAPAQTIEASPGPAHASPPRRPRRAREHGTIEGVRSPTHNEHERGRDYAGWPAGKHSRRARAPLARRARGLRRLPRVPRPCPAIGDRHVRVPLAVRLLHVAIGLVLDSRRRAPTSRRSFFGRARRRSHVQSLKLLPRWTARRRCPPFDGRVVLLGGSFKNSSTGHRKGRTP
jgi:hypothetical protein